PNRSALSCKGHRSRRADRAPGEAGPVRDLLAADAHRPLSLSVNRLASYPVGNGLSSLLRLVVPKGRIPNLDLTMAGVAAGRGETLTVGAERQAVDKAAMAAQRDRLR